MKLFKVFRLLFAIKYRFLFRASLVIVDSKSKLVLGRHVKIAFSKVVVKNGNVIKFSDNCRVNHCVIGAINTERVCEIVIGSRCTFDKVQMQIEDNVHIGNDNHFSNGEEFSYQLITVGGPLRIGNNNFLKCRIWQRFGGILVIGDYNSINQRTELRSDEKIEIGSYNMISYDCNIWDTNTHNIYAPEIRRKIMHDNPEFIGIEIEKPKTIPVYIGDDCWIGRYVTVMKGACIGNRCVVGYHSFLFKGTYDDDTMIYTSHETKTFKI